MTNRSDRSVDTVFNSAARRYVFVILAVLWAAAVSLALAACGQAPQINSAIQSGTSAARGSTPSGPGSTPAPVSSSGGGGTSAACPTQGVGGDTVPALCAAAPSTANQPDITLPASESAIPTVSPNGLSVTDVLPSQGSEAGGDSVTIDGTGFCSAPEVAFGEVDAQAVAESATEIVATSPPEQPGEPTVDITVTCDGSVSPVVAGDEFSYLASTPSPSITPSASP
jgi:IPT/TIG domain